MGKFFSIPGVRIHQSDGDPSPSIDPSTHPRFKEFYDQKRKRGDNANAQVGIPAGTSITIDGQPGVVEREERSAGGDITTYIKGSKSGTRAVKWGQDAPGQLTIRESRRIHD